MVKRYNRKRTGKVAYRRKYAAKGKKKKYNNPSTGYSRSGTPFPDRFRTKHKFTRLFDMTAIGGQVKLLRGNSIFDPDYQTGGSSVEGYSLFTNMYNRYMVNASKIRLRVLSKTNTIANAACQITLFPSTNNGAQVNEEAPGESYAKSRLIGPADGVGITNLSSYMSTRKIMGLSELDYTDFSTDTTSSPTKEWYWIIDFRPLDGSSALSHYIQVTMTYYVEWSERVQTSQV